MKRFQKTRHRVKAVKRSSELCDCVVRVSLLTILFLFGVGLLRI